MGNNSLLVILGDPNKRGLFNSFRAITLKGVGEEMTISVQGWYRKKHTLVQWGKQIWYRGGKKPGTGGKLKSAKNGTGQ